MSRPPRAARGAAPSVIERDCRAGWASGPLPRGRSAVTRNRASQLRMKFVRSLESATSAPISCEAAVPPRLSLALEATAAATAASWGGTFVSLGNLSVGLRDRRDGGSGRRRCTCSTYPASRSRRHPLLCARTAWWGISRPSRRQMGDASRQPNGVVASLPQLGQAGRAGAVLASSL